MDLREMIVTDAAGKTGREAEDDLAGTICTPFLSDGVKQSSKHHIRQRANFKSSRSGFPSRYGISEKRRCRPRRPERCRRQDNRPYFSIIESVRVVLEKDMYALYNPHYNPSDKKFFNQDKRFATTFAFAVIEATYYMYVVTNMLRRSLSAMLHGASISLSPKADIVIDSKGYYQDSINAQICEAVGAGVAVGAPMPNATQQDVDNARGAKNRAKQARDTAKQERDTAKRELKKALRNGNQQEIINKREALKQKEETLKEKESAYDTRKGDYQNKKENQKTEKVSDEERKRAEYERINQNPAATEAQKNAARDAYVNAMQAVYRWIVSPDEVNSKQALDVGNECPDTPAGLAANGLCQVLLMCALHKGGTRKLKERYEHYFDLGVKVLIGENNWDEIVIQGEAPYELNDAKSSDAEASYKRWKMRT